jgi:hypothetical protein
VQSRRKYECSRLRIDVEHFRGEFQHRSRLANDFDGFVDGHAFGFGVFARFQINNSAFAGVGNGPGQRVARTGGHHYRIAGGTVEHKSGGIGREVRVVRLSCLLLAGDEQSGEGAAQSGEYLDFHFCNFFNEEFFKNKPCCDGGRFRNKLVK